MSNIVFQVYRNQGAIENTTKDWAIGIEPVSGVMVIKYGKTGQKLRTSIVKTPNPQTEIDDRVRKKVQSGYFYVGKATYDEDAKVIELDKVINPTLFWSITNLKGKSELIERMEHLMSRMMSVDLPESCDFIQDKKGATNVPVGQLMISNKLVFDLHGVVTDGNNKMSLGGVIENNSFTLTTMFILAVSKGLGTLSFSNEDNQTITIDYLGNETQFATPEYSLELLNDIAIALALKKSAVSLYQPTQQTVKPLLQLSL